MKKSMKISGRLLMLIILLTVAGCSVFDPAMREDTLIITRKYVGDFLDYRTTKDDRFLAPEICWVKTTLENQYGKIAVFAKKEMKFDLNDRLYIRRTHYQHPGINNWVYFLESSDSKTYYVLYGTSIDESKRESVERILGNIR